jgi:hypothetical protein
METVRNNRQLGGRGARFPEARFSEARFSEARVPEAGPSLGRLNLLQLIPHS